MSPAQMADTQNTAACERNVFSSIPKLLANGANWSIYKMRLEIVIQSLGHEGHFTGKSPCPTIPALAADKANAADIDKAIEAKSLWKTCESHACHVLASTIPNITLCKVYGKKSVAEMWATVCLEYQDKTALAQSDMRAALQSMRCKENGNLRAHLDLMCKKKDDLVQARVNFTDKEFSVWIIGSLPCYYAGYISNLTSAAKLLERGLKSQSSDSDSKPPSLLTLDDIILFLKQEYDVRSCEQSTSAKTKDVALAAVDSRPGVPSRGKQNRNGSGPPKSSGQPSGDQSKAAGGGKGKQKVCWQCGGTGHCRD
jgi:hypothetical protein